MRKILLLIVCVSVFVGIGYLSGKYILSNSPVVSEESETEQPAHDEVLLPKTVSSAYRKMIKNTELDDREKTFLQKLEKVSLGQEIFWLTKAQAESPAASAELKGLLCSESVVMLESIDEFLKGLPPLEFSLEKIQVLKLALLCETHLELVKVISLSVLEKEIVSGRLDLAAAKNEDETNLALTSQLEINVVLTAHALFMESVGQDTAEAWQGTRNAILAQKGTWIKSRIAQQYIKKYPSEKEAIRSDLMALVGAKQTRAPAAEEIEDENEDAHE